MCISIIISLIIILSCKYVNCAPSNIDIKPNLVIINSTMNNTMKFLCRKRMNDYENFKIHLSHNISSDYIQISTNRLNDISTEIIVQSFDYIGAFLLICSSTGKNSASSLSRIIIGKHPGVLNRVKRCIVYYDEYIECTFYSPVLIQAMSNRLIYNIRFDERPLPFQPKIYQDQTKLIEIDNDSKTFTYRFFPKRIGYFPSDVKMYINATIDYFGTTYYKMDMTPNFLISSNFTIYPVSSRDVRIDFHHENNSTLCHGNLSREDVTTDLNLRDNLRTFMESNQTTIHITGLRPNTWYNICSHCRRESPISTISKIECLRYQTPRKWISEGIIISIFCFLLVITLIFCVIIRERDRGNARSRRHSAHHTSEEENALTTNASETTPHRRSDQL